MEQLSSFFKNTQDSQIESLENVLLEYQKINTEKFETLEKLHGSFSSQVIEFKETNSKVQQELEEIFAKIDEYEQQMIRVEKIIENSEKDISALEEYTGKPNFFTSMLSGFAFPKLLTRK